MNKIPLICVEDCESTTLEVQRLLADSHPMPFAVLAKTQSAGKGQRGRTWSSPLGNLYLSVAFPPDVCPLDALGTLPLTFASLICQLVEEDYGIKLTIKWPNDLLFAGAKLGGILVESSSTGQQWGPFIMGLGFNLSQRPAVPDDGRRAPLCLNDILNEGSRDLYGTTLSLRQGARRRSDAVAVEGHEEHRRRLTQFANSMSFRIDASHFAGRLLDKITKHLDEYRRFHFDRELYQRFAIEVGQWLLPAAGRDAKVPLAIQNIENDGSLRVEEQSLERKSFTCTSASSVGFWMYQKSDAPCFVLDGGNSRLKAAVFRQGDEPEFKWDSSSTEEEDIVVLLGQMRESLYAIGIRGLYPIHLGSVSHSVSAILKKQCEPFRFQLQPIRKKMLRLSTTEYTWSDIGLDRVAVIEGYLTGASFADHVAILVSCGTATTIDVLKMQDGKAKHLGGLILAGVGTQLTALHQQTSLLPSLAQSYFDNGLEMDFANAPLGKNTVEAMIKGVALTLQSTLQALVPYYQLPSKQSRIVLTGGWAHHIRSAMKEAKVDEFLVLKGLRSMVRGG